MSNQQSVITFWRNIIITPRRKKETTSLMLNNKWASRLDTRIMCVVKYNFFFSKATPYRVLINPIDTFCYLFGKSYHFAIYCPYFTIPFSKYSARFIFLTSEAALSAATFAISCLTISSTSCSKVVV